jgi:hypothetical protein
MRQIMYLPVCMQVNWQMGAVPRFALAAAGENDRRLDRVRAAPTRHTIRMHEIVPIHRRSL